MKKALFLLPFFILSACGTTIEIKNDNTNNISSALPSFLESNTNAPTTPVNGNTNTTIINENVNTTNQNMNTAVTKPVIDLKTALPHEVGFSCSPDATSYATENFYTNFLSQLENLDRYSDWDLRFMPNDKKQQLLDTKESKDNVGFACLAKDKSFFITIIKGDEGTESGYKIVRYNIPREKIEPAFLQEVILGKHWNNRPVKFGKRTGENIEMISTTTDKVSGKISSFYSYNYVQNMLTLEKSCTKTSCTGFSLQLKMTDDKDNAKK